MEFFWLKVGILNGIFKFCERNESEIWLRGAIPVFLIIII
jgi:hypothetical protein